MEDTPALTNLLRSYLVLVQGSLLPNPTRPRRRGLLGGHGGEHEPQPGHQGGEEGVPYPSDSPSEEAHHFGGDQRQGVQPHRRAPRPTCPTLRREPRPTPQADHPPARTPARTPARPPYTHRASMTGRGSPIGALRH